MKEIIRLENIKRDFHVGDEIVHALRGVSFTIYEGEFVTIMGTSGSGKSTLLNTLGCLDTPTSGEYYLDGVSVRSMNKRQRATLRNRKIGFVFQNYNLLAAQDHLSGECGAAFDVQPSVQRRPAQGEGDQCFNGRWLRRSLDAQEQPDVWRTDAACGYRSCVG